MIVSVCVAPLALKVTLSLAKYPLRAFAEAVRLKGLLLQEDTTRLNVVNTRQTRIISFFTTLLSPEC